VLEQVGSQKMVIVCCDRLLLAYSADFIKLTFMVVKIFLVRLFCASSTGALGGNCPPLPPLLRHCLTPTVKTVRRM